ncbi:MAG: glycoside hydrolase family 15 protein [bacterium]
MNEQKINELLETSRNVIKDAALPNGAIVAANTDEKYYPHTAKDYRYVWPRDAAYICIAADYLDDANQRECEHESTRKLDNAKLCEKIKPFPIPHLKGEGIPMDIQEPYFKWLEERPEDFKKEGLLYQNYSTNGKKFGGQFQPDQMGVTLFAIWRHFKNNISSASKYEILIKRLADGICGEWKGAYFFKNTSDLWEEGKRMTSTKMENNFTYTLAACASGLEKAGLIFPNNGNWKKVATEMRGKIDDAYNEKEKYFFRNHGKIDDKNIDASMLGLVWPFFVIDANDKRIKNTVKKMEEKLALDGGVRRFEMDYYDGEGTAQEGAGAWPLLNFWMSIYCAKAGDKKKAEKYFDWVIERLGNNYIPEQIFGDFREGKGVTPLVWSHAMFVISFYEIYN